jgi:hypothetical protein
MDAMYSRKRLEDKFHPNGRAELPQVQSSVDQPYAISASESPRTRRSEVESSVQCVLTTLVAIAACKLSASS